MQLTFIDFETYWDQEHTLKKMSPIEYCLHPKTEIQACAIKVGNAPTDVFFGESEIRRHLEALDWSTKMAIGHNMSAFDAMLLAWRFGIKPAMWGCTMAMARPIHAKDVGLGLGKLVEHYGIGRKNNAVLVQTRGRRISEFTPQELEAMEVYNRDDTEQCAALFYILAKHYTADELWHIDCNIRMLVEPEFDLDVGLLQNALSVERSNKHADLMRLAKLLRAGAVELTEDFWDNEDQVLEYVRSQMASAAKFSAILEQQGVAVPMKRSKTDPTKRIPAIAKTDAAMALLLEHDDELVATAARARLSTKSTQLETRIESFLDTHAQVGKLPVPAHYCGADTTGRDSGWLYNMYNLPRINPDRPRVSDALRNSVLAPKGRKVGVADLSGIELRVNHTLWQVARSTSLWKEKADADLYKDTASKYYGVELADVQKPQRQFAKVVELSAGFGIGPPKFRDTARIQGGLKLSLQEAKDGIYGWRRLTPEIADRDTGGWAKCHEALEYVARGDKVAIDPWGLCTTEQDAIVLPSGRRIRYPNLRQEVRVRHREDEDGELISKAEPTWIYDDGRHETYLYGGKVDENIVQALARDIIFPNALTFWRKTGLRPKHKVYDELVYLFRPEQAEDYLALLQEIMRTPPPWWPELVLWSEGDIADSYGAAK